TRATEAGVEDLRAALPKAELVFLDYSPKPAGGKTVARLVTGKGDLAVADWIKSIGGKAVIQNGSLVEASFPGASVGDEGLKSLEDLSLLGSPIKDSGLAALPELASLKRLSLATTDITDEGMKYVSGLTTLERLDLTSTDIHDKGIEQLKDMTGLTELILDY